MRFIVGCGAQLNLLVSQPNISYDSGAVNVVLGVRIGIGILGDQRRVNNTYKEQIIERIRNWIIQTLISAQYLYSSKIISQTIVAQRCS